jgi:hypothetical protein
MNALKVKPLVGLGLVLRRVAGEYEVDNRCPGKPIAALIAWSSGLEALRRGKATWIALRWKQVGPGPAAVRKRALFAVQDPVASKETWPSEPIHNQRGRAQTMNQEAIGMSSAYKRKQLGHQGKALR